MILRRPKGFSLLELLIVIAILSVTFVILFPRLPGLGTSKRNSALRRLAGCVQATHEDALFKKKASL